MKIFKWVADEDGDIGIEILGIVTLTKYKQGTVVSWFKKYPPAAKYVVAK